MDVNDDPNTEQNIGSGAPGPSPTSASSQTEQLQSERRRGKRARRYGFACTTCKARKVKCSGEQPICSACRRSGTRCEWQTGANDKELQRANERISHLQAALQQANDDLNTRPGTSGPVSDQEIDSSPGSVQLSPAISGTLTQRSALWFQVGRGEDGSMVYNGPTSRFHVEALDDELADGSQPQYSRDRTPGVAVSRNAAQAQALAFQYSLLDNVWASLIPSSSRFQHLGVDSRTCMVLLDIYWIFLQPLHNVVYRPSFLMDMSLGGRYYSDFLLLCIMSLAARHLPEHDRMLGNVPSGDQFMTRAKELLFQEMDVTKPNIPTIQGLLILGGRQCAMGKSSEGWLYTGMALRMLVDVGMHLHIPDSKLAQLEQLTAVEIETRKRIYNSAYVWDKTISLALGRPPSLTQQPYSSDEILDHSDDLQEWKPVHTPEIGDEYIPVPSYNTMTFCAHAQLHRITTEMMLLFSHISKGQNLKEEVEVLHSKFDAWYCKLPDPLKIEEHETAVPQSPPPHIVSLNILYHALYIVLYRPNLGSKDPSLGPTAIKVCTNHSKRIMAILGAYERTFPYRLMTYQLSYCVFMAATVEAYVVKHSEPGLANEAAKTLGAAMRVLYNEAAHTPGISRSLDTIRRQLATWRLNTRPNQSQLLGMTPQPQLYHSDHITRSDPSNKTEDVNQEQSSTATLEAFEEINGLQIPLPIQNPSDPTFQDPTIGVSFYNNASDFSMGDFDTGAGFHPDAFPWTLADMSYIHSDV